MAPRRYFRQSSLSFERFKVTCPPYPLGPNPRNRLIRVQGQVRRCTTRLADRGFARIRPTRLKTVQARLPSLHPSLYIGGPWLQTYGSKPRIHGSSGAVDSPWQSAAQELILEGEYVRTIHGLGSKGSTQASNVPEPRLCVLPTGGEIHIGN